MTVTRYLKWAPLIAYFMASMIYATAGSEPDEKKKRHVLLAPPGYYQTVEVEKDGKYSCPEFPDPYTDSLVFTSKYKGSDSSRSKLNKKAERRYEEAIKPVRKLESVSTEITKDFIKGSGLGTRECLLDLLYNWAKAEALLHEGVNHIGQAVRKWALATTGADYLQIMQLNSGLPPADPEKIEVIENWFADLAEQVVDYYSDRELRKVNNHDYWAAWAVMVTAINLQNKDLYEWAINKYREGTSQIDGQGYLPNEVKRESRALLYQNFALQPLVMLAAFAEANDEPLEKEHQALKRAVKKVVEGIHNPHLFEAITGEEQKMKGVVTGWSLAWIPAWKAYFDPEVIVPLEKKISSFKFKSTRLGGDLERLFLFKSANIEKPAVAANAVAIEPRQIKHQ